MIDIKNFTRSNKKTIFLPSDENGREICVYELNDVVSIGTTLFYPNLLFGVVENGGIKEAYNPIIEKTMSLKCLDDNLYFNDKNFNIDYEIVDNDTNYYFVYNTDNYYHFIYDTLPYLITFKYLKNNNPNIKLLMNYPNSFKTDFYRFVEEFLEIIGINFNDIKIINEKTLYKKLLISNSYTHDIDSNLPPRKEIYEFYKDIIERVINENDSKEKIKIPKKIYISRRSWKHGDTSNIGTNYTTRRKLENEDELVVFLTKNGFNEIFTELLTTREKIILFYNADVIVGSIGGGLCNVLFSKNTCKLLSIVSPHFLDFNKRFLYSFKNVNLNLFEETYNTEKTNFKKYMRVKYKDIVGEIAEIDGDDITISYVKNKISGWNNDIEYNKIKVKDFECIKLDDGLNSSWYFDLNKFKNFYDKLCNL